MAILAAISGKVEVKSVTTGKLVPAKQGMFLYEGDLIKTGDNGKASLFFMEGSEIKISSVCEIILEGKDMKNAGDTSSMKVVAGRIWAKYLKQEKAVKIVTPTAICAVKGTEFEVNVLDQNRTEVIVIEGLLELMNSLGKVMAGASTKTTIMAGQPPEPPQTTDLSKRDKWETTIQDAPNKKNIIIKLKTGDKEDEIKLKFKKK